MRSTETLRRGPSPRCRADASNLKKSGEIGWIESAAEALAGKAFGRSAIRSEEIEADAAQRRKIGGGKAGAGAAGVFLERYVEAPVELILHAPVAADGAGKVLHVDRQAAQIVAALHTRHAADNFARGFH